jgi:hypothetical protein
MAIEGLLDVALLVWRLGVDGWELGSLLGGGTSSGERDTAKGQTEDGHGEL